MSSEGYRNSCEKSSMAEFEDFNNMCRLCLSTTSLVSVFDDRLESKENMREIVEVTTGVKISPDDEVSHMLCNKCSHLTIKMFKFRNASMLNNIYMKEKAYQKKNMHKSIRDLLRQDPKLKLPSWIHRCDISPVVVLDRPETYNLKAETQPLKRKKSREQQQKMTLQNDDIKVENAPKEFKLEEEPGPSLQNEIIQQPPEHIPDQAPTSAENPTLPLSDENDTITKKVRKNRHKELPLFTIKTITKSLFICDVCNKVHYNTRELKKHRTSHMRCSLCRTSFSSMEETKKHGTNCKIKKIMSHQPRLSIKRCDEIEEIREKYSNAFRNFVVIEISDDENDPAHDESAGGDSNQTSNPDTKALISSEVDNAGTLKLLLGTSEGETIGSTATKVSGNGPSSELTSKEESDGSSHIEIPDKIVHLKESNSGCDNREEVLEPEKSKLLSNSENSGPNLNLERISTAKASEIMCDSQKFDENCSVESNKMNNTKKIKTSIIRNFRRLSTKTKSKENPESADSNIVVHSDNFRVSDVKESTNLEKQSDSIVSEKNSHLEDSEIMLNPIASYVDKSQKTKEPETTGEKSNPELCTAGSNSEQSLEINHSDEFHTTEKCNVENSKEADPETSEENSNSGKSHMDKSERRTPETYKELSKSKGIVPEMSRRECERMEKSAKSNQKLTPESSAMEDCEKPNEPEVSNVNTEMINECAISEEKQQLKKSNVENSDETGLEMAEEKCNYVKANIVNSETSNVKSRRGSCEVISLLEDSDSELDHTEIYQRIDRPGKAEVNSKLVISEVISAPDKSERVMDGLESDRIGNSQNFKETEVIPTESERITNNTSSIKITHTEESDELLNPTTGESSNPKSSYVNIKKIEPSLNSMDNQAKKGILKRRKSTMRAHSTHSKKPKTDTVVNKEISEIPLSNKRVNSTLDNNKSTSTHNNFKPDISFGEKDIFEVNDVENDNAYLENILRRIKSSRGVLPKGVQTSLPLNSDILKLKTGSFSYEMKNLKNYLSFSQIPVTISYAKSPSIKYTYEPSSLMRSQEKLKNSRSKRTIPLGENKSNILVYRIQKKKTADNSESGQNRIEVGSNSCNVQNEPYSFASNIRIESVMTVSPELSDDVTDKSYQPVEQAEISQQRDPQHPVPNNCNTPKPDTIAGEKDNFNQKSNGFNVSNSTSNCSLGNIRVSLNHTKPSRTNEAEDSLNSANNHCENPTQPDIIASKEQTLDQASNRYNNTKQSEKNNQAENSPHTSVDPLDHATIARNEEPSKKASNSLNVNSVAPTETSNCFQDNTGNLNTVIAPQIMNMENLMYPNNTTIPFLAYSMNNIPGQNTMNRTPQFYLVKNPNGIVSTPMTMITSAPVLSSNAQAYCASNVLTYNSSDNSTMNVSVPNLPFTPEVSSTPQLSINAPAFGTDNMLTYRSGNSSVNVSSPISRSTLEVPSTARLPPPLRQVRFKNVHSAVRGYKEGAPLICSRVKNPNFKRAPSVPHSTRPHVIQHSSSAAKHITQIPPSNPVFVAPLAPPPNRNGPSLPKIRIVQRKIPGQSSAMLVYPSPNKDPSVCNELEQNKKNEDTTIQDIHNAHTVSGTSGPTKYIRVKNLAELR